MASITKTAQLLSDVETTELLSELQRRLNCAVKPEKHVILVGKSGVCQDPSWSPREPRLLPLRWGWQWAPSSRRAKGAVGRAGYEIQRSMRMMGAAPLVTAPGAV